MSLLGWANTLQNFLNSPCQGFASFVHTPIPNNFLTVPKASYVPYDVRRSLLVIRSDTKNYVPY